MRFMLPLFLSITSVGADYSVITGLPPDPRAINANNPSFGLVGDGVHDDTLALVAAINATYAAGTPDCSEPGSRIVFLAGDGKLYRLSSPVILPMWVRLIGWGVQARPVLTLANSTPGYGSASILTPMLSVVNWAPPAACHKSTTMTGGNTAFGTGVINVDVRIDAGNPGAVGVSNGAAQGGILRAMKFVLAPDATAAIYSPGWAHQELTFYGGRYGILVNHTGAWPSILRDCLWEGQGVAAVAWVANATSAWEGLTLIRANISSVPVALDLGGAASSARITVLNSTFSPVGRPRAPSATRCWRIVCAPARLQRRQCPRAHARI